MLIEADKRGISSHGIGTRVHEGEEGVDSLTVGRLKPIYCDRLDDGILRSTAPLTIIKDNDATALVSISDINLTKLTWLTRLMETTAWD